MRDPVANASVFPMALCEPCGRTVLTYVAITDGGEEARSCVHCDAPILGALRWVSAGELEEDGYYIGSHQANGCGSGGCGSCSVRKN